jgi:hypothetical protein
MALARKEMVRTGFKRAEPKPSKGPKLKKCRVCKEPYEPRSPMQRACSTTCAIADGKRVTALQKAKAQRQERAQDKAKLESMKPAKWWKAKAKTAMHLYVRTRDAGKPCASCDTILLQLGRPGGDYDAGHLRSVGSAKHLEFDERNVFGQCKYCNDHLKGNQLEYERRLRLLKGDQFVDELRADNTSRHYKIADYQAIELYYKNKLKQLKEKL